MNDKSLPNQNFNQLDNSPMTPEEEEAWKELEKRQSHNKDLNSENKIITEKGTK